MRDAFMLAAGAFGGFVFAVWLIWRIVGPKAKVG